MREAIIQLHDKDQRVDLPTFLRLRISNPEILKQRPRCPDCGRDVHTFDEKGAKGFRIVDEEVSSRGKKRALPGFHHYDHGAAADCPQSFANDPRYFVLHRDNNFDTAEKQRNMEVLAGTNMRRAVDEAQAFFMQRLTGSSVISPLYRAEIEKIERKVITMAGIAVHPWIMAYLPPLMIGSVERPNRVGGTYKVEYQPQGQKLLPFTKLDGERRNLSVPERIMACFSRRDGKTPNPLRVYKDGPPIVFEVSSTFAHDVVKEARDRQARYRARTEESPTLPLNLPIQNAPTRGMAVSLYVKERPSRRHRLSGPR